MKKVLFACAALLCVLSTAFAAEPARHGAQKEARPGIVLAFFGSTDAAVQAHVDAFAAEVRKAHPDAVVMLAYTASRARAALRERGKDAPSVAEALARMPDQGVRRAVVQSMHVMPGYEFHDLVVTARAMQGLPKGLEEVRVSPPLMGNAQGLGTAAKAMLEGIPARAKGDAVLFVGHGTDHGGGLAYPALQYALWERDPLAFVAVLGDGKFKGPEVPSGEDVLQKLKRQNVKKVYLAPLLTVAGVHMKEDIAGKDEDSWSSRLRKAGFDVVEVRHGLLENTAIRRLYLENMAAILKSQATTLKK